MEIEVAGSSLLSMGKRDTDNGLRVKRKTLQAVLDQCQRTLELLSNGGVDDDDDDSNGHGDSGPCGEGSSTVEDREADELCDLLKSRVECPDFLKKLGSAQLPQYISEDGTWDVVSKNDLWECDNIELDEEDYVLVSQEDIVEGMACFMAAYLLSLKQTKEVTPNQLQEALCKTFSVKKKKGKLRKAWDGSKVIYNVASWGATAIGIYQNPALLKAASDAFWASCRVLSKLI